MRRWEEEEGDAARVGRRNAGGARSADPRCTAEKDAAFIAAAPKSVTARFVSRECNR
jgi:hypothetical protein